MSHFGCLVQQGTTADVERAELERRLATLHAKHYPGEQATFSWTTAPAGFMFTEGRRSTSSIISCRLSHQTSLELRERYMRGVCDLWSEVTGCTDHEIVVSITEAVTT